LVAEKTELQASLTQADFIAKKKAGEADNYAAKLSELHEKLTHHERSLDRSAISGYVSYLLSQLFTHCELFRLMKMWKITMHASKVTPVIFLFQGGTFSFISESDKSNRHTSRYQYQTRV